MAQLLGSRLLTPEKEQYNHVLWAHACEFIHATNVRYIAYRKSQYTIHKSFAVANYSQLRVGLEGMSVTAVTDAQWADTLTQHPKLVVKYYADWCGQCRMIAPKFARLSEAQPEVAFIEVDAEHNPTARKTAGVDNLPFFAIFRDGQLVAGEATGKLDRVEQLISQLN